MKIFDIIKYKLFGRKPWAYGYVYYRDRVINDILNDENILDCFLKNKPLPHRYGYRLDERVIEYPWLFSRINADKGLLLDAGSVLNHKYILNSPLLKNKSMVIYNIAREKVIEKKNVSYLYGDLRNTSFESNFFDEIVCISTLEHVGMDNTFIYSKDNAFRENKMDDYKIVIREFRRLLAPGGRLFLTVPYGKYENLGWQQQFDEKMIREIFEQFGGKNFEAAYFKYTDNGWQISKPEECGECAYFDIHKRKNFDSDYAAAARAVACIKIVK